jgi:hypothetical protein
MPYKDLKKSGQKVKKTSDKKTKPAKKLKKGK